MEKSIPQLNIRQLQVRNILPNIEVKRVMFDRDLTQGLQIVDIIGEMIDTVTNIIRGPQITETGILVVEGGRMRNA